MPNCWQAEHQDVDHLQSLESPAINHGSPQTCQTEYTGGNAWEEGVTVSRSKQEQSTHSPAVIMNQGAGSSSTSTGVFAYQTHAYVSWVNSQLHKRQSLRPVTDLSLDLRSGVVLIHLVEILSRERICNVNMAPRTRHDMIANVDSVLRFLAICDVRMHPINPIDIVDGKTKAIMRLILALASHYKPNSVLRPRSVTGDATGSKLTPAANRLVTSTPAITLVRSSYHQVCAPRQSPQKAGSSPCDAVHTPADPPSHLPLSNRVRSHTEKRISSFDYSADGGVYHRDLYATNSPGSNTSSDRTYSYTSPQVDASTLESFECLDSSGLPDKSSRSAAISKSYSQDTSVCGSNGLPSCGLDCSQDCRCSTVDAYCEEALHELNDTKDMLSMLQRLLLEESLQHMDGSPIPVDAKFSGDVRSESPLIRKQPLSVSPMQLRRSKSLYDKLKPIGADNDDPPREPLCASTTVNTSHVVSEKASYGSSGWAPAFGVSDHQNITPSQSHQRNRFNGPSRPMVSSMSFQEGPLSSVLSAHHSPHVFTSPTSKWQGDRPRVTLQTGCNHRKQAAVLQRAPGQPHRRLAFGQRSPSFGSPRFDINSVIPSNQTKLIYHINASSPAMCLIAKPLRDVCLLDVKMATKHITCGRPFRFHFKCQDIEFGAIKVELLGDADYVPHWNGKVVAWLEDESS